MPDDHLLSDDRSQKRPRRDSGAEVEYLLRAEEQLLHSISGRVPLEKILDKICNALNSEIGNMVSLVSLADDDAKDLASIVKSAGMFGLYKFCSASVSGGNDEELGSIEMYSYVSRRPFLNEIRLIERASCLAAVAIGRHNEESSSSRSDHRESLYSGESCSTTLNSEVLTSIPPL